MLRHSKKTFFSIFTVAICVVTLAACSQIQALYSAAVATAVPTDTPRPTATVLPPTATVMVCGEAKGKISDYVLPSKILKTPIPVKVYIPPCYNGTSQYPVLYMLHGMTYLNDQWVRIGLTDKADELISSGEIKPMIIVMPQEDESMSDPNTSQYGMALVKEVIPFVDTQFSTCSARECRAIGGLSRGGNWAVRLGLSDWQQFIAIGAHSTPLFINDLGHIAYWLRDIPGTDEVPYIYMDMGKADENKANILQFNEELDRLNISHEFFQFEGYHDEKYWSEHVETYLRWYAGIFASEAGE